MIRKRVYKYILLLGITLLFTGCHSSTDRNDTAMYTEKNMNYFGSEKTQMEAITGIDIQTDFADVEIIASDDYYIEYEFYYVDKEPQYKVENGILYFNDSMMNSGDYSISLSENCYIKLYVPNTAEFEHVSIYNSNGEVAIGTFSTKELEIEKSFGNVIMSRIEADHAKVALNAGSMTITKSSFQNAEIENLYGEITLNNINYMEDQAEELPASGEIKVNTSSGNIMITDLWCEKLVTENTNGNIELKGITAIDVESDQSSGNYSFNGYVDNSIDVQTTYGNAYLLLQGESENYGIKAESGHGSVIMNGRDYGEKLQLNDREEKQVQVEVKSGNIDISFKG